MPRLQVYGKRSRCLYDPAAIFASPQRLAVQTFDHVGVLEPKEHVTNTHKPDDQVEDGTKEVRTPLSERSANTVPRRKQSVKEKNSRKPKRKQTPKVDVSVECLELETRQTSEDGNRKPSLGNKLEHEVSADIFGTVTADSENIDAHPEGSLAHENPDTVNSAPVASQVLEKLTPDHEATTNVYRPQAEEQATPKVPQPKLCTSHCEQLLAMSSHPVNCFSRWSDELSNHFGITKIAEASFGEVYRLSLLEQVPGLSSKDESVFKVIALRPPESTFAISDKRKRAAALKKAEAMSRPQDVANEVKLLQRMTSIPGFTNFRDVRIVQGRPGKAFVRAFKAFNASQKARKKDVSNFPDPGRKTSYSDQQLWAVIEMQDAGVDLERYVETAQCRGIWSVWDIFWQVVLSLAKGEEGAEFEHRDLHLGNICVRCTTQASDSAVIDVRRKLGFAAVETTIIDYTISRALMPDSSIAFHDLSCDSGIFQGDSTDEYQYEIYRHMRSAVYLADPLAPFTAEHADTAGSMWKAYHPITNLCWLHFVLYKLLEQVNWPSASKAPPRKQKAEHATWKRANDLEHKLLKVQSLLDPEVLCRNELRSAADIIGLALREGWLDVDDVVGANGVESSGLVEDFSHLVVRVDLMEECGLDIAKEEARAVRRTRRHD